MTAWELLRDLHKTCQFQTKEGKKVGIASSGELKRWLVNGAVIINGEKVAFDEQMDFPIFSFVMFPKSKITLF